MRPDPIGLRGGFNPYVYVNSNPVNFVDPHGLEIRVYSSDAFGIKGLNHAFVYSTDTGRGKGTNGSSWHTLGDGVGPLSSPYNIIPLPEGMTEAEFMDAFESAPGWNNWIWTPWINDCHSDSEDATEYAGAYYPGAPNGRVDFDDEIKASFWDKIMEAANQNTLIRIFLGNMP